MPAAGSWTVNAPPSRQGTVSVDSAGKRVDLNLARTASGTILLFR
jgi:hypothetical protein